MQIEDIIASAAPDQKTVPVCVLGGISRQVEALEREIIDLRKADDSLDGATGVRERAERIQQLEAQAAEHTYDFTVQSIGAQGWRRLTSEHPPTDEQRAGFGWDVNPDTFQHTALAACCISPAMTVEQAKQLEAAVSDGQWSKLWNAILEVNVGAGRLGKSELATAVMQATEPSSTTAASEGSLEASSSDE